MYYNSTRLRIEHNGFSASYIAAKFVDARMRLGVRGLAVSGGVSASTSGGDDEVEQILDRTMTLFRCIHGKDVFEAFYKKVRRTFPG